MKFSEAMKSIEEGKTVKSCEGKLRTAMAEKGTSWITISNDEFFGDWEIEEEDLEELEIKFTLRIPFFLVKKIDELRNSKVEKLSRNQWILKAINNSVNHKPTA